MRKTVVASGIWLAFSKKLSQRCDAMNPTSNSLLKTLARAVSTMLCAAFSTAPPALAQITAPNGAAPQDSRAAPMGSQPATPASGTLESNAPQSSEAKSGARAPSEKSGQKTEGAGGFGNGLYGTGAGNNK
jgi:hypothetical protein